jgi:hypothetical protein
LIQWINRILEDSCATIKEIKGFLDPGLNITLSAIAAGVEGERCAGEPGVEKRMVKPHCEQVIKEK